MHSVPCRSATSEVGKLAKYQGGFVRPTISHACKVELCRTTKTRRMEASNASKKLGLYCLWLLVVATLGVIVWVLSALKPVYSHRAGSQRGLVILIHGLWMRSPCMAVLGSRLAKAGYGVAFIDYGPRADPEGVARRIACMVNAAHAAGQRVYLVGHSCGGNLALLSCRDPEVASRVTSVVCLGSPLLGSASARELRRYPAGAYVLGRAGALLCRDQELPHPTATRVAMLAGTRPHGGVASSTRWARTVTARSRSVKPLGPVWWNDSLLSARTRAFSTQGRLPGKWMCSSPPPRSARILCQRNVTSSDPRSGSREIAHEYPR